MAKKATTTNPKTDLVAALRAAGEEDLAEIRARIADLSGELESLKAAERMIDCRLHGKPQRKSPARRGKHNGAKLDGLAGRIHDVIQKKGPGTVEQLATSLDSSVQAIRIALTRKADWFEELDSGRIAIALSEKV